MHIPSTEIKSLSEKWIAQINLSEENCVFCVEILRSQNGLTACTHIGNLSNLQNKTNFIFLLENYLKSV